MRKPGIIASLLVALFAPLLVVNCSSNMSQTAADKPAYPQSSTDSATAALASAGASSADYRISPRDILDLSVFQVPDLTKTIQVSDSGDITLPLIGKTRVAGKTTHEMEEMIASKLRKKYLQSPQVSVLIKQYGQRVTISGAVVAPKVLPIEGSLTLTQAIAMAGGLNNDIADTKRVHVARSTNGHVQDEIFNYDEIAAGHANDPTLQGGDLIVAEQSGVKVVFKNLKDMLPFAVLASIM